MDKKQLRENAITEYKRWLEAAEGDSELKEELLNLAEDEDANAIGLAALEAGLVLNATGPRTLRFLPPLDCMLWDRKLIAALFDFHYKWEIYTPEEQRRYGYYVLPVLCGERFVGRIEPVCDRRAGVLQIRHFWPEEDVRVNDRFLWALEDAAQTLCRYHELSRVVWAQDWLAQ